MLRQRQGTGCRHGAPDRVDHQDLHRDPAGRGRDNGRSEAGRRPPSTGTGAIFNITLQGSQLAARLTGQPALPAYTSAEDAFYDTAVDAQLGFARDTDGKIDALVLHQNGADQRATRLPQIMQPAPAHRPGAGR